MKTVCPVCCNQADLLPDGTLGGHDDGAGIPCIMIGRMAAPWDEASTRPAVSNRSGGVCEYCLRRRAREMHHRKSRGVGGRWSPCNIIHLCAQCHRDVTRNPTWAKSLGLRVLAADDPAKIPVTRENQTAFQPTDNVARGPEPRALRR